MQWPLEDDVINRALEELLLPDKYQNAGMYTTDPDYPYSTAGSAMKQGGGYGEACTYPFSACKRRPSACAESRSSADKRHIEPDWLLLCQKYNSTFDPFRHCDGKPRELVRNITRSAKLER